jgi:hypothetical protein
MFMNASLCLRASVVLGVALIVLPLALAGCGGSNAPTPGGASVPPAPVPPGEDEMKGAMDKLKTKAGAKGIPGVPKKA